MERLEGGENCITRSFIICTLPKNNQNYLVEEEVGGTCGTNGMNIGKEVIHWEGL
jgi:hypothetical protein